MIYYKNTLFGSGPKLTAVQSLERDGLMNKGEGWSLVN